MKWGLISHPYHRGGVTSWMMDFFTTGINSSKSVRFLTCSPKKDFISSSDKKSIFSLLKGYKEIVAPPVDFRFELGSFSSKVAFYKKLITQNLPAGSYLIPSDDEAVWQACSELADKYVMIGVLHSDDPYYYYLSTKYEPFIGGFVSVSERIKTHSKISAKHTVIPCGINISDSIIPANRKKQLVFVGRIEEKQKRVSDLPKLFKEIIQLDPEWRLLIIGNGVDLATLKESFHAQKLSPFVHFYGWLPNNEVRSLLEESRILLQTSNYEGMSVAVMEALSAGCQILSSKVSGVEDLAKLPNTESIISIFPVGELGQAKAGFKRLNKEYSIKTASESVELAKNHFSIESCWARYEEFCQDLFPVKQANKSKLNVKLYSDLLAILRFTKFKITR